MKSQALADFKAEIICSSEASGLPYSKLSLIEQLKRTGSYPT
jgi:hypothetical protein